MYKPELTFSRRWELRSSSRFSHLEASQGVTNVSSESCASIFSVEVNTTRLWLAYRPVRVVTNCPVRATGCTVNAWLRPMRNENAKFPLRARSASRRYIQHDLNVSTWNWKDNETLIHWARAVCFVWLYERNGLFQEPSSMFPNTINTINRDYSCCLAREK
jgi:hypothetical protein